jgi:hypothetical protein
VTRRRPPPVRVARLLQRSGLREGGYRISPRERPTSDSHPKLVRRRSNGCATQSKLFALGRLAIQAMPTVIAAAQSCRWAPATPLSQLDDATPANDSFGHLLAVQSRFCFGDVVIAGRDPPRTSLLRERRSRCLLGLG